VKARRTTSILIVESHSASLQVVATLNGGFGQHRLVLFSNDNSTSLSFIISLVCFRKHTEAASHIAKISAGILVWVVTPIIGTISPLE
jgi:hypothetical protein